MTDFFHPTHKYVRKQDEISAKSVDKVGGKGSSLGELASIVKVPPFFCLTVRAFDYFIDKKKLEKRIEKLIEEKKYIEIQTLIIDTELPKKLKKVICEALTVEPFPAVKYFAVRSSSISEDSDAATYAGQYETYLFVNNDIIDLSLNIKKCWASLFEERAIIYRSQLVASCRGEEKDTDWKNARLGVVVQQQVPSDVSGVMFTVDPVSQSRLRLTIDSIWGLGEAFVSGHVNPDHFVIERTASKTLKIVASAVSHKEMRMVFGGDKVVEEDLKGSMLESKCSMSDALALELAALGEKIQEHYGKPMDVEYGIVIEGGVEANLSPRREEKPRRSIRGRTGLGNNHNGNNNNNNIDPSKATIYILQARPITTLYPAFSNLSESDMLHCFRTLFCWGYLQVQTEPMTPLGLDMITPYASIWGPPFEAGGRIYIDTSFAGVNPMLRFAQMLGFKYTDQEASEIMASVYSNTKLMRKIKKERSVINQQLNRLLNIINKTLYNYCIHTWHGIKRVSENNIKYIEDKYIGSVVGDDVMKYGGRYYVSYFWSQCSEMVPDMYLRLFPVMYAGVFAYIQMKKKIRKYFNMPNDATTASSNLTDTQRRALELFEVAERGFSGNPSTEMEIAVDCIVNSIKPAIERGLFDDLVDFKIDGATQSGRHSFSFLRQIRSRLTGEEKNKFDKYVERFFRNFGFRGPLEIDVGVPRYRENPSIIIGYIKACITAHIVKCERETKVGGEGKDSEDRSTKSSSLISVNNINTNTNGVIAPKEGAEFKDRNTNSNTVTQTSQPTPKTPQLRETDSETTNKQTTDTQSSPQQTPETEAGQRDKKVASVVFPHSESSSTTSVIVKMLGNDQMDPAAMQNLRFKEGEKAIIELKSMLKGKKAKVVYKKLKLMRCGQSYREHHKWLMVRMLSVFRAGLIKRVVPSFIERDLIDTRDDIFFLKAEEICDICDIIDGDKLDGAQGRKQAFAKLHREFGPSRFKGASEDKLPELVKRQVTQQKEALEKYRRLTPPRFLSNSGELLTKNSVDSQSCSNLVGKSGNDELEGMGPGDKFKLNGVGASSGCFKGKCCVAKSPHDTIERGCVLVCTANDAGWAPLLSTCSALVIEIGGVMTHGSVVARELGIPCVVGVTGAMSIIKTGDVVTVDGASGVVIVERGETEISRCDSRTNIELASGKGNRSVEGQPGVSFCDHTSVDQSTQDGDLSSTDGDFLTPEIKSKGVAKKLSPKLPKPKKTDNDPNALLTPPSSSGEDSS